MNMIMLLIVAVAVFAYYGGASCPKILKDNKQMLMGVVVGLLLGSFFGIRIEGAGPAVGGPGASAAGSGDLITLFGQAEVGEGESASHTNPRPEIDGGH